MFDGDISYVGGIICYVNLLCCGVAVSVCLYCTGGTVSGFYTVEDEVSWYCLWVCGSGGLWVPCG